MLTQDPTAAPVQTITADPALLADVAGKWLHLVRLPELVRHLASVAPMPIGAAVGKILDAIVDRDSLPLFRDRGQGEASPVSDADRFSIATHAPPPHRPLRGIDDDGFRSREYTAMMRDRGQPIGHRAEPPPTLAGRAGALAWLRSNGLPTWLALLHADALHLVDELTGRAPAAPVLTLARPPAPDPAPPTIQPAGAAWPHKPGDLWTDAERVALFKMRHLLGMMDQQIADAIGEASRQNISHQIGARKAWKTPGNPAAWPRGLAWRPPADLLAECKLYLQPLQAVAVAVTAT